MAASIRDARMNRKTTAAGAADAGAGVGAANTGGPAAAGALFIVATPIGNLGDITRRAVEVLGGVDLILAEDTRRAAVLLRHLGIRAPVQSFHRHNEAARLRAVLRRLASGARVALISDAGTPLISDPGHRLVQSARTAGVTVTPLPGANAAVAALSAAGLPAARFVFEGFLPAAAAARARRLRELQGETRTLVFYEASHRIAATLAAMAAAFGGDRAVAVAREISKLYETFYCGDLAEVARAINAGDAHRKGEFVIVAAGAAEAAGGVHPDRRAAEIMELLCAEMPPGRASRLAAQITGANRNALYAAAVKAQGRAE